MLDRLSLSIQPDDRIALLGSNGNGKSTFCKLVGGRLDPLKGEVKRSTKMDVAYFAQHQLDELNPRGSAFDHVAARMPDVPVARHTEGSHRFSRLLGALALSLMSLCFAGVTKVIPATRHLAPRVKLTSRDEASNRMEPRRRYLVGA